MFKKTKRNFYLSIFVPLVGLYLITFLISAVALINYNINNYEKNIISSVDASVKNFLFHIDNISSSNENLKTNDEIINYLEDGTGDTTVIKNLLTTKSNQNQYIIGINIYPTSDEFLPLYSSQISGVASKSDVFALPFYDEIKGSDVDNYLLIRNQFLNSSYNFNKYDAKYGMMSLVSKIKHEDSIIGYIFIDFSSFDIYKNIFTFTSLNNNKEPLTYLIYDNIMLYNNLDDVALNNKQYKEGINGNLFSNYVIKKTITDKISLISTISSSKLNKENAIICLILIAFYLILIGIVFVIVQTLTKEIITSLTNINRNINEYKNK